MRILAIRGRNLASLEADFAVDFTQEPLASSGLFAISGPTGAGKSTLLDALCLGLYDATPRLSKASGRGVNLPDVRDETISAQDPRNLLRRGTHEACAEVDFVGNDGLPYCTRWTVRRARGRADGKLQASEMRLRRLTDQQAIGGTKTEVLAEIQARLGLTFDQFTRAVLLAQNEFASFLKADDNERAELLETLTGADTFTGISRRAFERCKQEQEALKRLRDQLDDQQPLGAESRAVLTSARVSAEGNLGQLEQSRLNTEAGLRWHESIDRLRESERLARASVERAMAAKSTAEPRRTLLASVESVQDARPLLMERERTTRELTAARALLGHAEQDVVLTDTALKAADAHTKTARARLTAAEGRRATAKPDLDRARTLDAEIAQLVPRRSTAEQAQAAAELEERQARESLTARLAERDRLTAEHATTIAWLTEHAGSEPLALDWPRWDTLFDQAEKTRNELQEAHQDLLRLQRQADETGCSLRETRERLTSAQRHQGDAERSFARAADALSRFDSSALAEARKAAEARRDQLVRGEQIWRHMLDCTLRVDHLERNATAFQATIRRTQAQLLRTASQRPARQAAQEQAESALKRAELACADSVEELRNRLEPDRPCPVCGATAHPWAEEHPRLHALFETLRAEAARCRAAFDALKADEVSHQTVLETAQAQWLELEQERPDILTIAERTRASWADWPLAHEALAATETERLSWFTAQQSAIQERLDKLDLRKQAWRSALAEHDAARTQLETMRAQLHAAEQQEAAAGGAAERAALSLKTAQIGRAALERKLDVLLLDLNPPLADRESWRESWVADGQRFHQTCRERAEQYRRQRERATALHGQSERLAAEIAGLQRTADRTFADLRSRRDEFQRIDIEWVSNTRSRRGLLEDRPVADVEAALQAGIEAAAANLDQRLVETRAAADAHARAVATRDAAQHHVAHSQQAYETAAAALETWLAAYHQRVPAAPALAAARLHQWLVHDTVWIVSERQDLAALDDEWQRQVTVLQERQSAREALERECPTSDPAEILRTRAAALLAALDAQRKQLAELDVQLLQDDERCRKAAELSASIAEQENRFHTWAQLNELIGSADGKKFRNFAQQLTLDVLLAYANRHLGDLSRRYRLERIRDTLGLMVVDQDMGDEIRSVHSLSGGETFLVSLALALGLASLSSNRVRVESLFVDEGFGSLDAETLATAMDALDCLQSQGRKVGVISHVREMTERIGTQIQVKRLSGGQSRVEVIGG